IILASPGRRRRRICMGRAICKGPCQRHIVAADGPRSRKYHIRRVERAARPTIALPVMGGRPMKALAATMVFLSLTVVAAAKPTPVSSLNTIQDLIQTSVRNDTDVNTGPSGA